MLTHLQCTVHVTAELHVFVQTVNSEKYVNKQTRYAFIVLCCFCPGALFTDSC
jgi:Gpi18-like mannosyltransferase